MIYGPHEWGNGLVDAGPTSMRDAVDFRNGNELDSIRGQFVLNALKGALLLPPNFTPNVFPLKAIIRGEPIFYTGGGGHVRVGSITKLEDGTFAVMLAPGFTCSASRLSFDGMIEEGWHTMSWNAFLDQNPARISEASFGEQVKAWWSRLFH